MTKKLETFFKTSPTKDKRLLQLRDVALAGKSRAVVNAVLKADRYSGILAALVEAGSPNALADKLGVNYQAVQQWVLAGYVPLGRITEIEALYGIPRADLIDPKYAAAMSGPSFSDEA
jgi:hypothetical protein